MTDRIHARIDAELKQDVAVILGQLGLSESEAIRLFYKQIKLNRGLPFEVKIPNEETLAAFVDSDEGRHTLRRFESVDSFKASLS